MDAPLRRRGFLQSASVLGLGAGLGNLAALGTVLPARAAMRVTPDAVRFRPEIEPVVRWIEETPREKALEVAVAELKSGLSYRDLFAGIFLAGIRNIKPRPVGYKFHAVMAMNSAHLLALSADPEDSLLPMLWALDNFKNSQAQDVREGDWTLTAVDEAHVPSPSQARTAFIEAMDHWDEEKADAAIAGLCRCAGAAETMEALWRFAVRDQRNIGHKPIFAMQCWRALQTIGWQHAEPVVRSLAFGMLDRQGDSERAAAGPYEANLENVKKVREGWTSGKPDPNATQALLATLREASGEEASAEVVKQLNAGVAPGSLWDAVLLYGNEMFLAAPGIAPLHAVTAANALHYIHDHSGEDDTRKLALLQAAGWQAMYRGRVSNAAPLRLDHLEPIDPEGTGESAIADIFATADSDRREAAAKVVGFLGKGGTPEDVFAAGRRMIFHKGPDSHQYKYGAAIWEEVLLANDPRWQAPLTAAALAYWPGAKTRESGLMRRAREAVATVLG